MKPTYRLKTKFRQTVSAMLVWVLSVTMAVPVQAVTITGVPHGQVEVRPPQTQLDGKIKTDIVQSTARAIVHASDFNIAPNHIVNITQPIGGWMLARVFGPATQIEGALNATASFILLNPNGVFISPGAQVNVGGMFAASTLNLSNSNFLNGMYLFQDSGTNGAIKNAGAINAGMEGVYLFAPNVENAATGIITSTNGHVSLGAGKTAFLSNRPDGKGFLSEITAPTDQALNVGSLLADGGQVTMAGRVVNQAGLVRADSVLQRNGRIELVASEQATLQAGSQTLSRGSAAGAHGGTVVAKAANRDQNGSRIDGTVSVESGAQIHVTPGSGAVAGEVWLGGTTVNQNGVVSGTTHRLIPDRVDLSDAQLLSLAPGVARGEINVLAMDDINVTSSTPLDALGLASGQAATFHLNAGRNLTFNNSTFQSFGSRWNIVGRAGKDLIVNGSEVGTAGGGSIHLHAGAGLSLVDGFTVTSKVDTARFGGGDVSLTAVDDVVAPSPLGSDSNSFSIPGIHVGTGGNLIIRAGRDFRGAVDARDIKGGGFTLRGGIADVAAGRDVGSEATPVNLILGSTITDPITGAVTVPKTEVNLKAGRSLYFGLAEDYGLRYESTLTANGTVNLIARTGDILIKPGNPDPLNQNPAFKDARRIYPANFSAQADEGSVIFETGTTPLTFWPSATGSLTIAAKQDIKGQGKLEQIVDTESVLVFVGRPGDPTAQYVRVSRQQALSDPALAPWFALYGDLSFINGAPINPIPVGALLPPAALQEKPIIVARAGNTGVLSMSIGDVSTLLGQSDLRETQLKTALTTPAAQATTEAVPVSLLTESGNITGLRLDFFSPSFLKEVLISSGNDIRGLFGTFAVPVLANNRPAVRILARGSIDLKRGTGVPGQSFAETGLLFVGKGTGQVRANGNIDLGDSTGIQHLVVNKISSLRKQGGLLDIGAGGNIEMTQTQIATVNGASIIIHGADGVRIVDATGRPIPGAVETRAVLIDQSGKTILALPNQTGAPVPIEAFKKILAVDAANLSQTVFTAQDVRNGQVELVWKPLFVEQTGQLFLIGGERVRQGDKIVFNEKVVLVDLNPARGADGRAILTDGRPALVDGSLMLEIGGQQVSVITPVGGKVNVGGNSANTSTQTGIVTQRGGNITIHSTGNVDVNRSRVGTFDTGDIVIKSTSGTINAGSGSKDEKTIFLIDNGDGTNTTAVVPGSGIFTWERDDPDFTTLPFPKFNTPQMDALFGKITKRRFLGRDASELVAEFDRLTELRKVEFDQIFEDFIQAPFGPGSRPLQLGDITLIAAKNIDVPEAGIRGRRITLEAGDALNLLGGSIIGKTTFSASSISGSLGAFAGAAAGSVGGASVSAAGGAGGSSVGGLSGATSTVSATASSSSSTSAIASKAAEQVQQTTGDATSSQSSAAKQVASKSDDKDKKTQVAQSVKMKRGVVIQVDVKPVAQPGS